jgi:hypothetical protein
MHYLGFVVLGVAVSIWSMRLMGLSPARRRGVAKKSLAASSPTKIKAAKEAGRSGAPAELQGVKEPLERYHLYARKMEAAYKNRKTPKNRQQLLAQGRQFYDELEKILPALRAEMGPVPDVLPLKWMAITLEEDGRIEEALSISQKAKKWKLGDGTKTGFEGRILRLERKRKKEEF